MRQDVKVHEVGEKIEKVRLRWFGHVRRPATHYITGWTMEKTEDGKRPRGRLRQRLLTSVNDDYVSENNMK